ncbi:MAG: transglutaminase-like domain-containing protein [Nonlabens sp.]
MTIYNSRLHAFFTIGFLAFCSISMAQLPDEVIAMQKKYPDEKYVRLVEEQIISIDLSNNNFEISYQVVEEDMYLSDEAHLAAKDSRTFSHFFELDKIEASSWYLDNGKYRKSKVKDFKSRDRLDQSFRDDSKTVSFYYDNLGKGSKSKLDYTINIRDPRFLPTIFFADNAPIISKKATLKVDKDIDIKLINQNLENTSLKFEEKESGRYKYYTWTDEDLKGLKYEPSAPSFKRFAPHVIPVITQFKSSEGKWIKMLDDVPGLYSWYNSLVRDINTEKHEPDLVNVVNDLMDGKNSELEKVKAIYYWTQENIKYIAFEYALGGFIPREANDVFSKKYGDCKDNSSLMKEMMEIAGLKGSLSWLGTRDIPYDYDTVSTPSVDNHMILTYKIDDKRYFLDATGRFQPIDIPTSFIQGKQILIEDGNDNYILDRVPVIDAAENYRKDSVEIKYTDGKILGNARSEYGGYRKIDIFNTLERIDKSKHLDYLEGQLRAGSNKFLIDEWSDMNLFSYEDPYLLKYKFNIADYSKELGNEIYLNLNLYRGVLDKRVNVDRELPIEYDYKNSYAVDIYFTVPDGYDVDYLPKNFSISDDLVDASINYQIKGNQILYSHSISLKYLELDKSQQINFNSILDQLAQNYNEVVVLKKK